ncbi:MAG: lipase family protein [Solirubrobacteraceae bacterium]
MSTRTGDGGARLRALSVALGVTAILVGIALTLRPFTSLDALTLYVAGSLIVTGIGELLSSRDVAAAPHAPIIGGLLVLTGLVAALVPGLTVRAVAIVVGIGMLLSGAARLAAGWRGDIDERYSSLVGGLAGVVFGILALAWSDVTILVIALLVGPVAIIYGARQILRALRVPRPKQDTGLGRARIWLRGVRATTAVLFALLLVLVSALVHKGSPTVPSFYTWSGSLPDKPGVLLRQQTTTQGMPGGSRALRILYTTTGLKGRITPASALVIVSSTALSGPRPVLLWEHGTTGVARKCAPSILKDPFTAGALFVQDQVLAHGWVLVAPDYIGLGASPPHPYLVGVPEARSALDAVRAARQITSIKLSNQTVVWGHSQGGGAALWTGIEAPSYAPDVPLSGVAALAPASDTVSLAESLETSKFGMLFASLVLAGYSNAYPDVAFNHYVRASARPVVRSVVGRCLNEPATLLSLPAVLTGEQIFSRHVSTGPLGARLAQNVPARVTKTPTLIAQGEADSLVLPPVQNAFAHRLCQAGQQLEYRTYPGLDHVQLVEPNSPLIPYLLNWTESRFKGATAPSNCSTT